MKYYPKEKAFLIKTRWLTWIVVADNIGDAVVKAEAAIASSSTELYRSDKIMEIKTPDFFDDAVVIEGAKIAHIISTGGRNNIMTLPLGDIITELKSAAIDSTQYIPHFEGVLS